MTELRGTDDLLGCMSMACYSCQLPFLGEALTMSLLEMMQEIRRKHLWIMRLNIHHEGKRGNPYDRGRTYVLGRNSLTARYKGNPKSRLYEMVTDDWLSQVCF